MATISLSEPTFNTIEEEAKKFQIPKDEEWLTSEILITIKNMLWKNAFKFGPGNCLRIDLDKLQDYKLKHLHIENNIDIDTSDRILTLLNLYRYKVELIRNEKSILLDFSLQ